MKIFRATASAALIMMFLPGAALAQRVVGAITSPGSWSDVALYQTGDKFFVSDYTNNQILVYDAGTLAYLSSIPLSAYSLYGPERLAVHEGTGTLYVSLYRYFPPSSSTIVIINANTYSVIGSLTDFESDAELFMDESRGRLYMIANHRTLTAINCATNTIAGSLDVGLLFSPTGARVQFGAGNILNPVTGELVFGCLGGDGFVVVDGPNLTGQLITSAGSNGWGGTWNPHENKLYITRALWNGYFIYDRDTATAKIAASFNDGTSLFYSPATNRIYSGAEVNWDSTVIEGDTDAWQDIEVGGGLSQVGFVTATHHAYFACSAYVRILDEDTLTVVDTITGCGAASVSSTNIVIDQNRRRVFIQSHWSQGDSDPGNSCVQVIDDGRKNDFNGDGQDDILWRYDANGGFNSVWFMGTGGAASPALAAHESTGAETKGRARIYTDARRAGDGRGPERSFFDAREAMGAASGAGTYIDPRRLGTPENGSLSSPEIRWPNPRAAFLSEGMENPQATAVRILGGADLPAVGDLNWEIVGTGDFNGDGRTDLLWRYNGTGGFLCVWYLNGTTVLGGTDLPSVADLNWQVAGTGDFNGDGKVDILWRYQGAGGYQCVWFLNGTAVMGGADLAAVSDLTWQVAGLGDFNSDGKIDILWRYQGPGGYLCVWFMNGTAVTGGVDLPIVGDLTWQVREVADFNGDGKPDLIWRYDGTGGYNCVWFLNGTTLMGGQDLASVPDLNWKIVSR